MFPPSKNQDLLSELVAVLAESVEVFVSVGFSEVLLVLGFSLGPLEERRA
jgi:hypothetical protein